jgi:hypothetical protein
MATSLAANVREFRFAFLKRIEVARRSVEALDVTFRHVIVRMLETTRFAYAVRAHLQK